MREVATVTVDLSDHESGAPLGMLLAPASSSGSASPSDSTVTILAGWERLPPRNKMGPVQRTGQVRLGDRLVRINNVDVTKSTFKEIMALLKGMVHKDGDRGSSGTVRLRTLSFAPVSPPSPVSSSPFDLAASTTSASFGQSSQTHNQKLYSFMSSIRRARVRTIPTNTDDDGVDAPPSSARTDSQHRRPWLGKEKVPESFVEYEIVCILVVRYGGGMHRIGEGSEEQMWSVWKRYSELKALDEKLKLAYGWHIDALNDGWGLSFPGEHVLSTLLVGNQDASFVERRKLELENYWKTLQRIEEIFDLNPNSQRFSRDVAAFLDVESHLGRSKSQASLQHAALAEIGEGSVRGMSAHASLSGSRNNSLSPQRQKHGSDAHLSDQQLLNIVLDTRSVSLNTSNMSSTGASPRRKKRIPGAAKAAFQRKSFD